METIAQLVEDLERHIDALQQRFLARFLPTDPSHRPEDFDHEVKAACVLAHAAFEEFVETISMHVMTTSMAKWKNERKASDTIISLCLKHGVSIATEDDEEKVQATCFDLLRAALDEAKKRHSKSIQDNHGFSIKYLRAALTPVFINPPDDLRLTQSLKTLAAARGSFAHTASRRAEFGDARTTRAKRTLSPEDSWSAISDCLSLCKEIAEAARKVLNPPSTVVHLSLRRRIRRRNLGS